MLDLDELLAGIPQLIRRLTPFGVFSVYLLDDATQELRIAYAEGYPEEAAKSVRLTLGQGMVGTAVQEDRSLLVNDVRTDPRYIAVAPGAQSTLVVPLRHKGKAIGALNLLSNEMNAFDGTTRRCSASSPPRWRRPGQRAAVRVGDASTPTRWRRWPKSAAR